jgi:hypothetical protein
MKRAAKKDLNQAAIVQALRAIGCEVLICNLEGWPDLLCHKAGVWLPVEVKRPRGKLTALQGQLRRRAWFPVVSSVAEALALFSRRQAEAIPSHVRTDRGGLAE